MNKLRNNGEMDGLNNEVILGVGEHPGVMRFAIFGSALGSQHCALCSMRYAFIPLRLTPCDSRSFKGYLTPCA